ILRLKPRVIIAWCVFQHKPGRPPYFLDYKPLEFTPTGNRDADVDAFTRAIAAALHDVIRRYPDQWLVFDASWQQQP
ncbi:hypothetical protein JXD38_11065, partial [candidate division WOR-3 bacterium]|nr:hypothetical protein [candidate division WOR-3 bacterium]